MAKTSFADYKTFMKLIGYNQTDKVERVPLRKTEKDYQFYEKQKGRCALCNMNMIEEGIYPPDFHHKDGDPANNSPENIIAICPNCHRKETFKQWYNKGRENPKPPKEQPPKPIDFGDINFNTNFDMKSLLG